MTPDPIDKRTAALEPVQVRFQGRISPKRKLKPGRYRLTVTATDSVGRSSVPGTLSFTIVKG